MWHLSKIWKYIAQEFKMVQNTTKKPSSQNYLIVELTFVLLVLTVMLYIVFGLPEFANETVNVCVHIKDIYIQELRKNSASNQILFSLLAVLFIVTMVWLCDRRRALNRLELCCLEEAKKDVDLKFKRILANVEHLQNINELNLKSSTKHDLPNKLQRVVDEFRKDTRQILLYNMYKSNYEL